MRFALLGLLMLFPSCASEQAALPAFTPNVRVGAAAVDIEADDSMVIGGGIHPGRATGQEGKLRAVAVVIEKPGSPPVAIVACDVLMMDRALLDRAIAEIVKITPIPASHILINATHTHHAPTSCTVHGYAVDTVFSERVVRAIVESVSQAAASRGEASFHFARGQESTVGQNSRLLLGDNTIFWIGDRKDALRPTGPFDPELPVLAFRDSANKLRALLFNHSTHSIGTRKGGVRSPSFYGLAAQELEAELGGTVSFLEGASGSTHNLGALSCDEMAHRIKETVRETLAKAEPRAVDAIVALKREFAYRVRKFDEAKEDEAVSAYCRKRAPGGADGIIEVFRKQRQVLAPQQGQERKSWIQAIRIGDVALVGVPAEFFTTLGLEIKRRSPFRHTYVAELANDWIGYLPDRKGFELGGYQTWTGLHSFTEQGTGEAVVEEALKLLDQLAR